MKLLILEDSQTKLQEIVGTVTAGTVVKVEDITSATDAMTAQRHLAENYYDMFIFDLCVPSFLGMPPDSQAGLELIRDIFSNSEFRTPGRLIGLTQYADMADDLRAEFTSYGIFLLKYENQNDNWKSPLITQIKYHINAKLSETDVEKQYEIYLGIICALEIEFEAIRRLPYQFKDIRVKGDPTLYIEGFIEKSGVKKRVVAAFCGRMGMSTAAITATKLIYNFRPEIIAMTGITGAVRGNANLGDVIIAEECWDWGMGKWITDKNEKKFLPSPQHIPLDVDLRANAIRLSQNIELLSKIRAEFHGGAPQTVLRVLIGPVASGSAVISTQLMTEHIQSQHRKLLGIEMESFGVYASTLESSLPRPRAISIKSASDFADDQKNDNYHHYCSYASAQILKTLIDIELGFIGS